jgi:hypothetical protein
MNLKNAWKSFRGIWSANDNKIVEANNRIPDEENLIDKSNKITPNDNGEVEKLKNQLKELEAKNNKLTVLQTSTKHKEDPAADSDWNKTMNRRAYMDDMWAIRERS